MRVTLSYEEQIINALSRVKHKRGDDFLVKSKREFDAMRVVLTPLYEENARLRAEVEALRGERDKALSAARMLRLSCENAVNMMTCENEVGGRYCYRRNAPPDDTCSYCEMRNAITATEWLDAADEKETT